MQFILSQEELDALKAKQKEEIKLSRKKLQALCTLISDTMPVDWGWGDGNPKPWGCIVTRKEEWYCDKCPVIEICPKEYKHWSK